MNKNKSGFTIVELLIVIVVIAILAAISIVAYNGIQQRANQSTIQTELAGAGKKFEISKIDSSTNTYPGASDSSLEAASVKFSTTNYIQILYCRSNDGSQYALVGQNKNASKTYAYGNQRTFVEYTTYGIGDYVNVCTDITGASSTYRFGNSSGWRAWTSG